MYVHNYYTYILLTTIHIYFLQTVVLSMSLSPSTGLLATVDLSGVVCIWELPSCNLKKSWSSEDMVRFSCMCLELSLATPIYSCCIYVVCMVYSYY